MAINYKSNCPDLGLKSVKIRLLLTLGHLNCISQSGIPQLKRHDGKQSSRVVVVHPEHGSNMAVRAATTCLASTVCAPFGVVVVAAHSLPHLGHTYATALSCYLTTICYLCTQEVDLGGAGSFLAPL